MCKVRCGLKYAFFFILISMKIRKTTEWKKKVKHEYVLCGSTHDQWWLGLKVSKDKSCAII